MLLHVQHHVEVAGRSAEGPGLAAAGKPDARAVFHAGWNLCVDGALPQNPAFALALWAWIGNHAARSLTGRTGPRDAEKALLIAHLPAAIAGAASRWTFARCRA